jgi:hypothetical protein
MCFDLITSLLPTWPHFFEFFVPFIAGAFVTFGNQIFITNYQLVSGGVNPRINDEESWLSKSA